MLKRSHTPFGHTLGRTTGWVHRAELARNGVRMLKGVEYRRIDERGVHITVDGRRGSWKPIRSSFAPGRRRGARSPVT